MNCRFCLLFAFAILFAPFCLSQSSHEPIVLDFKKALKDERTLKLSDIADSIKYVKLETSEDCLIGRAWVLATDDLIVTKVSKPAQLLVFDHSGKFLYNIGKKGQGPGEYGALSEWDISVDGKYLAVQDFYQMATHIFTLSGEYIAKIKSTATMFDGFGFIDDNTFMRFTTQNGFEGGGRFMFEAYDIPSLKSEKYLWKTNNHEMQKPGEMGLPPQIVIDENQVYYSDVLNDTLFSVDKTGQATPEFIYDLGKSKWPRQNITREEMEKYHHPIGLSMTKEYMFMNLSAGKGKGRTMVYKKSTKEFFALKPVTQCSYREGSTRGAINDLDGLQPYTLTRSGYGNTWASMIQITDLDDYREKGCWEEQEVINPKYRNQLIKLLESSDIEDNPIIRIIYLK